ncbi:YqgE/AlgH family protein [Deinococcus yavapaiensis]|uniref:UPF0301 protein DES52_11186 n=1 Tax=Deinococcus yavapaiensis KR-236 TaxID=694435 RepID=A0A318SFX5_9DEIO|nr:YqgE/AlgH family protein [Deinococcus yavapaiensis]PYE52914.1 putative transcriptional regulator [Deinococcus yavapaiensis KR-236]
MTQNLTYLVATPHMIGNMFERSVILLLDHNAEGAMGLIVSLQTQMPISELLPNAKDCPDLAWLGGPVDPQVGWCLYERPTGKSGEAQLSDDLYVTSSLDVLQDVMKREGHFMLILGYAGWGPGQLEEETHLGSWLFLESGPELALHVPAAEKWDRAWEALGVNPASLVAGGAQA